MNAELIDIKTLTPEQLASLGKQLRANKKARSGSPKDRNTLIDKMLQEKDGSDFRHTTSDILKALQDAKIVVATITSDEREVELKKIQTRKQKLVKGLVKGMPADPEKKTYGYKVSANGFAVTLERVLTWLATASPEDKAKVKKAVK